MRHWRLNPSLSDDLVDLGYRYPFNLIPFSDRSRRSRTTIHDTAPEKATRIVGLLVVRSAPSARRRRRRPSAPLGPPWGSDGRRVGLEPKPALSRAPKAEGLRRRPSPAGRPFCVAAGGPSSVSGRSRPSNPVRLPDRSPSRRRQLRLPERSPTAPVAAGPAESPTSCGSHCRRQAGRRRRAITVRVRAASLSESGLDLGQPEWSKSVQFESESQTISNDSAAVLAWMESGSN